MPFKSTNSRPPKVVPAMWTQAPFYSACILLLAGLLLGGIQSPVPVLNFGVEALALLYVAVCAMAGGKLVRSRTQLALAMILLGVPLMQLVPLPHFIWSELPNRQLVAEADQLIGFGQLWRPLTLSVEGTTRALIGLLPPIALFLTIPGFAPNRRNQFIAIVLVVAGLSLLMSVIQFGSSPGAFRFYRGGHDTVPVGIFANRNHQANFMLVCMPLAAAMIRLKMRGAEAAQLVTALVVAIALAGGVLATNSRTGFALLPIALAGAAWVFARGNPAVVLISRSWVLKVGLATAAATLVGFVIVGTAGARTLIRFGELGDLRFENWPLVVDLVRAHFPMGSGLGTFDSVFRSMEDLNSVSEKYFNHAHNDYLEVLLETGVVGVVLELAVLGVLISRMLHTSAWKNPLEFAAGVAIVLMLAHSLIDYPLRTYTLSMTFALCAALLLNPNKSRSSNGASGASPKDGRA